MKAAKAKKKPKTDAVLITQAELSEVIAVPTVKILRWVKSGAVGFPPPVKVVGRTYFFNRRQVLDWFRVAPRPSPTPD